VFTIASYNASAVKINNASAVKIHNTSAEKTNNANAVKINNASGVEYYNVASSLVRFENKNSFFFVEKRSSLLQRTLALWL
jgi:hypothetical protein